MIGQELGKVLKIDEDSLKWRNLNSFRIQVIPRMSKWEVLHDFRNIYCDVYVVHELESVLPPEKTKDEGGTAGSSILGLNPVGLATTSLGQEQADSIGLGLTYSQIQNLNSNSFEGSQHNQGGEGSRTTADFSTSEIYGGASLLEGLHGIRETKGFKSPMGFNAEAKVKMLEAPEAIDKDVVVKVSNCGDHISCINLLANEYDDGAQELNAIIRLETPSFPSNEGVVVSKSTESAYQMDTRDYTGSLYTGALVVNQEGGRSIFLVR